MNPILYQRNGDLLDGEYLPGQYRWSFATRWNSGLLICQPPTAGVLSLTLEIGSVLTDTVVSVAAGAGPITRAFFIQRAVPADTLVRWKVTYDGAPETAAADAALTMYGVAASISGTPAPSTLVVKWANALETLTLFNYDAETHLFSETSPGISSGRASIVQGASFSLSIQSQEVLRVESDTCYVPEFIARGGVGTLKNPRLIFCVNNIPIATLTKDELLIEDLTEDNPDILTPSDEGFYDRFEFYSGGTLTAALADGGLTAKNIEEPVPA